MKNLSMVFFFLMAFTMMSVNMQAQTTTCQPKDCKKVCATSATKTTTTTTTETKAQTTDATAELFKFTTNTDEKAVEKKASCQPSSCLPACNKKAKTSVTTTEPTKKTVAASVPKTN